MAEENPTWGYTRIRDALTNVGHRVDRYSPWPNASPHSFLIASLAKGDIAVKTTATATVNS